MLQIPLRAVPAQSLKCVLGGQNCTIVIAQKPQGVFVSVAVDNVPTVSTVIARDAVPLVCREYTGFTGNLLFVDTRGNDDPEYTGFGSRFALVYLTAEENALL